MKVFISYSEGDSGTVEDIEAVFERLDIESFRDTKDIRPGHSIAGRMNDGLIACTHLMVVISANSINSQWVPYEIGFARGLERVVVPYKKDSGNVQFDVLADTNYIDSLTSL